MQRTDGYAHRRRITEHCLPELILEISSRISPRCPVSWSRSAGTFA